MDGNDIMKFAKRSITLLIALLSLSACKAFDKEEPPMCPRVSALADTVTQTKFRPGAGRDARDIEYRAEITSYHGSCHYDPQAREMHVSFEVGIDAERRQALVSRHAVINYYVAIPFFRPDPFAKTLLPVELDFSEDSNRLHVTDDTVNIVIPMPNLKEMIKYEIFVGLQLTPEELAYNRQQKNAK
jgi:hypothetical protein